MAYSRVLFVFIAFMLLGCNNRDNIKILISEMMKESVSLRLNNMEIIYPDSLKHIEPEIKDYKLVIYSDTTNCSMCFVNSLKEWNDMLCLQKEYQNLSLIFIMQGRKNMLELHRKVLNESTLQYPIYLDVENIFQETNPHIPKNKLIHTFLLDKENNVIVVGNPLTNDRIKSMMIDVLNDSQGT